MLEKCFKLKEHGTTAKREIVAGLTTFLTMAYILAVNPNILSASGMNANAIFVATAVASAIATFLMAFLANYPIGLSAGLGLNAYFAYTVCLGELAGEEDPWRIALAAVFVEGIIFILLSFVKFRERIINGIPQSLKFGISAGIGVFVAFIGMQNAGIIVNDDATLVGLGDFGDLNMLLALFGLILIASLAHRKVPGGVLIGIIVTWIVGMILQAVGIYTPAEGTSLFPDFSQGLQLGAVSQTAFKLNFAWAGKHLFRFVAITFSFLYVDLFDTVGTVVGVADKAGLLDEDGNLPRVGKVFFADAAGTTCGALLGTSTITSFVESGAGVAAGGRTGLTALTTGVMFLVSLVLSPVFLAIPSFATAPALIYVGMLMVFSIAKVNFETDDMADCVGAYLALIMMPLSYSIATGIMFAVIGWAVIKIIEGKIKEISPVMWAVNVMFILRIIALITDFQ